MEKVIRKVKRVEIEGLYRSFLVVSSMKKLPLKKVISKNLPYLSDLKDRVFEEREMLLLKMIAVDENGEYAMREGYVPEEGATSIPFNQLIFEDGYDEASIKEALMSFDEEELEVEFYAEDINRSIKVSTSEGYETVSLEELLEDPNNDLSPAHLTLFDKFLLHDSIMDNI